MDAVRLSDIWVYLAQTPLLWLTTTIAVYQLAAALTCRLYIERLLNPVLVSIIVLVSLLLLTGTPYATYFEGAQFVHFLLGPATVALAIPLIRAEQRLRELLKPAVAALLAGSLSGMLSAVIFGRLFGLSSETLRSLLPKSVTTPIAMGISEQIGGLPALTAVLVILTGMVGSLLGLTLLRLTGNQDDAELGFALGLASHGLGTARALQISTTAGAFAGLAMGLNGTLTALLAPWLARLLGL
jgi:predicted murein hydrolase (TIGR00659 family)